MKEESHRPPLLPLPLPCPLPARPPLPLLPRGFLVLSPFFIFIISVITVKRYHRIRVIALFVFLFAQARQLAFLKTFCRKISKDSCNFGTASGTARARPCWFRCIPLACQTISSEGGGSPFLFSWPILAWVVALGARRLVMFCVTGGFCFSLAASVVSAGGATSIALTESSWTTVREVGATAPRVFCHGECDRRVDLECSLFQGN